MSVKMLFINSPTIRIREKGIKNSSHQSKELCPHHDCWEVLLVKKKKENVDCLECFAEKEISKTDNDQRGKMKIKLEILWIIWVTMYDNSPLTC